MLQAVTCMRCHGARMVYSAAFRRQIRCPECNHRHRTDASGLRQITEAARLEQEAVDRGEPAKFTGLDWTITKLREWGRWVRDRGIGYPNMAATEKARVGRGGLPGQEETSYPPDIEVIDRAVAESPTDYKTIIVEHYTKTGFTTEKAAHLGISRQTYYQRKASAERHIANLIGV